MKVCLTVDDVPMHASLGAGTSWLTIHQSFVNAFKSHSLPPVTGFVIGNRIAGDDQGRAVQIWMTGGNTVANHTYSHSRPNVMGAQVYLEDVQRNQILISGLNRLAPKRDQVDYFRYPYLDAGSDAQTQMQVALGLSEANLVVAPVTLSLADWYWNEAYLSCPPQRREALFKPLSSLFLNWAAQTLAYYKSQAYGSLAQHHIICWHVGVFQSRVIFPFIQQTQAKNISFVSLDDAMQSHKHQMPQSTLMEHNIYALRLPSVMAANHTPPPLPKQDITNLVQNCGL